MNADTETAWYIGPGQPRSYFSLALTASVLSHCILFFVIWSTFSVSVKKWLTAANFPSSANVLNVSIVPDDAIQTDPVTLNSKPQLPVAPAVKVHESFNQPKKTRERSSTTASTITAGQVNETKNVAAQSGGNTASEDKKDSTGGVVDAQILGIVSEYPRYSRQHHQEGRVVIKVDVNAGGKVTHTGVITSSGFPLLDEAAEKALNNAIFPADRLLASSNLIAFRFRLIDG